MTNEHEYEPASATEPGHVKSRSEQARGASMRPDDRLLTYRQVAEVLGCSDRTVWQLVRDGQLPVVRFRGSVRVDPADLRAFIDKSKAAGDPSP